MTKMPIGPNNVQVSVVKYAGYPSLEFGLNSHQTNAEVRRPQSGSLMHVPQKYDIKVLFKL